MPVAIDTSVLISAEKTGGIEELLPANEEGPFYIPALAAAEFVVVVIAALPISRPQTAMKTGKRRKFFIALPPGLFDLLTAVRLLRSHRNTFRQLPIATPASERNQHRY